MSNNLRICKMGKYYEECSKFIRVRNQNPDKMIICESKWEETGQGKKIGTCNAMAREDRTNLYHNQGRRMDGSPTGGHIDSY